MQEKRLHLHYFMPTYTLPLENGSFLIKILDVQKLKMAIYKGLVILKVVKIPQNQGSKLLNFLIFSCLTERFRGIPEGGSESIENKRFNKVLFSPAREFSWPFSRSYQYIDWYISARPSEKDKPLYRSIYNHLHYFLLFTITFRLLFPTET